MTLVLLVLKPPPSSRYIAWVSSILQSAFEELRHQSYINHHQRPDQEKEEEEEEEEEEEVVEQEGLLLCV